MGSSAVSPAPCPRCGRPAEEDAASCALCGQVLRRSAPAIARPRPEPPAARPAEPVRVPAAALAPWSGEVLVAPGEPERILGLPPRLFVLLAGLLLAPVLTWTPLLRYMGWFLASLVHETGHTAAAWVTGCPAFPAIRLDGHAAAVHRDAVPLLQVATAIGLLAWGWTWRDASRRLAVVGGVAGAWALVTFVPVLRETFFLWAGHLGELGFAAYALVQASNGGFSGTLAERCAHAGVGVYLVGRNAWLGGGLLTSASARAAYEANGSFGLQNDLVRVAREVLHVSVPLTGAVLLLLSLAVAAGGVLFALREGSDGA